MTVKINKIDIQTFNFSGGECQVSLGHIQIGARVELCAFLNSSDEIMRLILSVDAIRRISPDAIIDLVIPYFPYGRQDRVCNPGEAFSAAVMAQLINNLHCNSVTIEDPHSAVTSGLIKNVRILTQADIISASATMRHVIQDRDLILLAPDKGAATKTEEISKCLLQEGIKTEALFAKKVRDTTNGKITETIVPDGMAGKNILIPDDICDGGSTFIELAKKLKSNGAVDLYLYVTHGIFSKGLDPLKEDFKHIYCRNSFITNDQPEFLTILEDVQ